MLSWLFGPGARTPCTRILVIFAITDDQGLETFLANHGPVHRMCSGVWCVKSKVHVNDMRSFLGTQFPGQYLVLETTGAWASLGFVPWVAWNKS